MFHRHTEYWGYLTGQLSLVLFVAVAGEFVLRGGGGFSRLTCAIAVAACAADVVGNVAGLYDRFDEYDKVTHFLGVAAVTSGAFDVLRGFAPAQRLRLTAGARIWVSVALGISVGIGWEFYEFLTDFVFSTARVYGARDTFYDVISDSLGALTAGLLLWSVEQPDAEGLALEAQEATG